MSAFEKIGAAVDDAIDKACGAISPGFSIVHSLDGSLYYVRARHGDGYRPRHWLSLKKIEGAATQEMKDKADRGGIFSKPVVEIRINGTGEIYCREMLPFAFWSVKSGDEKPISTRDDLFKDYASISGWPVPPAWVR